MIFYVCLYDFKTPGSKEADGYDDGDTDNNDDNVDDDDDKDRDDDNNDKVKEDVDVGKYNNNVYIRHKDFHSFVRPSVCHAQGTPPEI